MAKPEDIITFLFDQQPHPLTHEIRDWLSDSPRFVSFTETYRDKIRKKIRINRDPEGAADLHAELEVACRLLADRRFEVAYEPYASAKGRGPDFAVTYRANRVFNVEVTRLRAEAEGSAPAPIQTRVTRLLLDKLGQLQPGMANLLVIQAGREAAGALDLQALLRDLKRRVETRDPAFYAAARTAGPAAFYKDFLLLSGILLQCEPAQLWVNNQARPAPDPKALRLAAALLGVPVPV